MDLYAPFLTAILQVVVVVVACCLVVNLLRSALETHGDSD